MKKIIVLFVFFILATTPVLGYLPDYQKDEVGDWNVQVKPLSGWEMFIKQLAISVEDNTYEPGETVSGAISHYAAMVCSGTDEWGDSECLGSPRDANCDGDSIIMCVHIVRESGNTVVGGDCFDGYSECSSVQFDYSVNLPNDADEGLYRVEAFYKYSHLLAEEHDAGSDYFNVEEEEITTTTTTTQPTTTTTQPTTTTTTIQCQDYAYKKCYNGNTYWYDSCDNRQKLYEDCEYGCNNGQCVEGHYKKICYQNDVYWESELGEITDLVKDCGSDTCDSWSTYCDGKDVRKRRTCFNRGCNNGECYETSLEERELITTCKVVCSAGECLYDKDNDGTLNKNDKAPNTYGSNPDGTPTFLDSIVNFFVSIGLWSR